MHNPYTIYAQRGSAWKSVKNTDWLRGPFGGGVSPALGRVECTAQSILIAVFSKVNGARWRL